MFSQGYIYVVVAYHVTIVAIGHGLLKKFWPLVLPVGQFVNWSFRYNVVYNLDGAFKIKKKNIMAIQTKFPSGI